jgi:hypothetical protein
MSGMKWLWMSLSIDYMLPIYVCIALISFDWASVAFITCFISPERLEWAVLIVALSISIDFMLFSSSRSLDAFVNPVSTEGSSEVRSMFSLSASEVSEGGTGVVTIAAYDKFTNIKMLVMWTVRLPIKPTMCFSVPRTTWDQVSLETSSVIKYR